MQSLAPINTLALTLLLASVPSPAAVSQWELDGDLSSATGGDPLVPGAAAPAPEPSVSFETVSIGGADAVAARFSRGTYFILTNGLGPNGGGRFLNRYSVILDVLFEDRSPSGGWAALVQTDPRNASDGDWFINPAGGLGISGQYGGLVTDGEWHRLGLAIDLVAGTLTSYIDGARVGRIVDLTLDGRFSAGDSILLFADEDRENAAGLVACVQVRDEALDDDAMALLGGPEAGGIPVTAPPLPIPVGLWSFEDPADLTAADIGGDLVLVGSHAAIEGTHERDGAARVGPGSHYRAVHGIPPSPGAYANAYSLAFDFRVPAIGIWYCFFQTNAANSNDGDCFVRTDGALGVGATGYSSAKVSAGTWYRLVVAVDNAVGRYDMYLDGERILAGTPQEVDGRFSLDPVVLFLADENGEDGPIDVAMIAVYDRALQGGEVSRLGGPGPFDPANRPPTVLAVPAGPETVDAQLPATFEFRAADEDGDHVRIRVSWGDGTVDDWGPLGPTEQPFIATHSFRRTGTLEIRAQAMDEHGSTSSWTRVQDVLVTGEVQAEFLTQPYLQNPVPGGISILWELDAPVASRLEYGGEPGVYDLAVEPEPEDTGFLSSIYRARLRGLPPGEHHYRVVAGSLATEDLTFRIPPGGDEPSSFDDPFSFSVWADSQGTNHGAFPDDPLEPTKAMMDHMAAGGTAAGDDAFAGGGDLFAAGDDASGARRDAFAIGVGDLAEDGAAYGDVRTYYLDRVAARLGRSVPWFVAWGNHDGNRSAVIRKFSDLPSGERPGFDPGWGSYSFDHANCHFVCLDHDTLQGDILGGWLEDDLAAAAERGVRFTFVFVHVPPFCEIWIDGDAWLRAHLVPLLEEYGVDICFSGHTHEYERGMLEGTYYVITGGGSWLDFPEPYTTDWPHMTVGGFHSLGGGIDKGLVNEYVRVTVDGDVATVEMHAFQPDGTYLGVLDAFSIHRCDNGNGRLGDRDGDGIQDGCEPARPMQMPSDANQDGRLDISDASWLLAHLFLGSPDLLPCEGGTASDPGPGELALLDANGDGGIDISDAVRVLGFLFTGAPPPELGTDCISLPGCPDVCR